MKNKTVLKRSIALLLALIMLFGLTACGGKDNEEEETTEAEDVNGTPEATEPETTEPETTPPESSAE